MPRISKKFALLLVLAMMATMFVGMGTASASTTNTALTIPTITVGDAPQALGTIQINETTAGSIGSTAYEQIVVTLPSGSRFSSTPVDLAAYVSVPGQNLSGQANGIAVGNLSMGPSTTSTLVINVVGRAQPFAAVFNIKLDSVIVTAGAADLKVNIYDSTNGVSNGDVIVAHVGVGGTSSYALATPTRSQGTVALGTLRIIENFAGALNVGTSTTETITVTLPAGVTWSSADVKVSGGFLAGDVVADSLSGFSSAGYSKAVFHIAAKSGTAGRPAIAGIIDITPTVFIDLNASKGDIVATIGGSNAFITPGTVVIGKYGEFGVTAKCDDPTNIYAGRWDAKIGTVVLSENVAATLVQGRTVNLELPEGCKWVTAPTPVTTKSSLTLVKGGADGILSGTSNRIATYNVNNASSGVASDVEFRQGTVAVPADFPAGDLNITFGGTAGAVGDDYGKVTVKAATIVAPITLTGATPSPTIIIGKQDQTDTTFDVVEAGVGAIAAKFANNSQSLYIDAPAGVYFSELPEISVTGDLKIDTNGTKLSTDDKRIIIPITTSSATTASTISFKNVHFTLDRTVPEGSMKLSATGGAVDQWYAHAPADYALTAAAKGQVANVTTPAPDQQNKTATFVIGQSNFTLEGVEITMDVAPYIKDGRTFLPIAYVAQALGIDAANVIWDATNQTVTLMKGDKVLQLKVGSATMLVNGAAITLDAAPEINNSRTCLPVALVAKAFGQSIAWDAATQTVTINP